MSSSEVTRELQASRLIYPFYRTLIERFDLEMFPCKDLEEESPDCDEVLTRVRLWFGEADKHIDVAHIRQLAQSDTFDEPTLRVLIWRHVAKEGKTESDRYKVDFLLGHYLAMNMPPELIKEEVGISKVASALAPVVGDSAYMSCLEDLEKCLRDLGECHHIQDLLERRILERGKTLKADAGEQYFHQAALIAFTRFNFVLRRRLIDLLGTDLQEITYLISELQLADVHSIDCTAAGLEQRESTDSLRDRIKQWRKPFQGKYSDIEWLQQISTLRNLLKNALEQSSHAEAAAAPVAVSTPAPAVAHGEQVLETSVPNPNESPTPDLAKAAVASAAAGAPAKSEIAKTVQSVAHATSVPQAVAKPAVPRKSAPPAAKTAPAPLRWEPPNVAKPAAVAPAKSDSVGIPKPVENRTTSSARPKSAPARRKTSDSFVTWLLRQWELLADQLNGWYTDVRSRLLQFRNRGAEVAAASVHNPSTGAEAPGSDRPAPQAAASAAAMVQPSAKVREAIKRVSEQVASLPPDADGAVSISGTRLDLSAPELNAFRRPHDNLSGILQRSAAVRLLLLEALDKTSAGDGVGLKVMVKFAYSESTMLQDRITQARNNKDVDGVVLLSACSKALASLIERVEEGVTGAAGAAGTPTR